MGKIRRHYIFSGDVQGVGFRYRAVHTARYLGVTGWVRNLPDGSVEMEAEGTAQDLESLILSLEQNAWGYVSEIRSNGIPVQNDRDFEISF